MRVPIILMALALHQALLPCAARHLAAAADVEQVAGTDGRRHTEGRALLQAWFNVPGITGRIQYDRDNGYCGEATLQSIMVKWGVWLPQIWVRQQGGGELLPGVNYGQTMTKLRVAFASFTGRGYSEFIGFAKQQLKAGLPVIAVTYLKGYWDSAYDHVVPVTAIATRTPAVAYDPADTISSWTDVSTTIVPRAVGGWGCPVTEKNYTIFQGGCVPLGTRWGFAVSGPTYAGGAGRPPVRLTVPSAWEPAFNTSALWTGSVTISRLQAGRAYRLHKFTNLAAVPATPTSPLAGAAVVTPFTAVAAAQTLSVSWQSATPAWYIAEGPL